MNKKQKEENEKKLKELDKRLDDLEKPIVKKFPDIHKKDEN